MRCAFRIDLKTKWEYTVTVNRVSCGMEESEVLEIVYAKVDSGESVIIGNSSLFQDCSLTGNQIINLLPYSLHPELTIMKVGDNTERDVQRNVFFGFLTMSKLYKNLSILHDHLDKLDGLEPSRKTLTIVEDYEEFFEKRRLRRLARGASQLEYKRGKQFYELPSLTKENVFNKNMLKLYPNKIFADKPTFNYLDQRDNTLHPRTVFSMMPIMSNFKPVSSYLFLEGNHFICDCPLFLVYSLRNDSYNRHIKQIQCIWEEDNEDKIEEEDKSQEKNYTDQPKTNNVDPEDLSNEEFNNNKPAEIRKRFFGNPQHEQPCYETQTKPSHVHLSVVEDGAIRADCIALSIITTSLLFFIWFLLSI